MTSPRTSVDPASMLLELDGYRYPMDYRWLRLNGFQGISPWRWIDNVDEATTIRKEFLIEVGGGSIPVRDLLPFTHSEPGDDFAGFVQSLGQVTGEICVVHLTFRGAAEVSGYPLYTIHQSVWDWLMSAVCELRDKCNPRAVAELEQSLFRQGV